MMKTPVNKTDSQPDPKLEYQCSYIPVWDLHVEEGVLSFPLPPVLATLRVSVIVSHQPGVHTYNVDPEQDSQHLISNEHLIGRIRAVNICPTQQPRYNDSFNPIDLK